jgi:hypothetical protein
MSAFVRIVVPETRTDGLSQSSYLRLGAYSHDEENLVTNLTTTSSSDSSSSNSAVSSADSSTGPSSSMGDKTATVTDTNTGTYTTQNLGVLAYTDKDFQANVQGAALMKVGNGHTTEVTNGDALYQVDQGGYTLKSNNNIVINAGFNGAPANIELTASDYIKQTANGPLSVITYGNADSQTIGNSADFFLGTKFSCTIGTSMELTMSVSMSLFLGYEFSMSMCSLSITFFFENSFIWGNQIQLQNGIYFKEVTGSYINMVIGNDVKTAATSAKILDFTDFKIAPESDLKTVGVNGTVCNVDLKSVTGPKLSSAETKIATEGMVATVKQMEAHSGDFEVRTKASIIHM